MAIPDVNIPIKPVIIPWEIAMKAERAAEKVHERMLRTARAMEAGSVPFVVIGGNAVAIRVATRDEGAVRNTRDVDILLDRSNLDAARDAMSAGGFDMEVVNGSRFSWTGTTPCPAGEYTSCTRARGSDLTTSALLRLSRSALAPVKACPRSTCGNC